MPQMCEICKKTNTVGNKRSHSNRATKRKWKVNLQKMTLEGRMVKICMSCMKTAYKQ